MKQFLLIFMIITISFSAFAEENHDDTHQIPSRSIFALNLGFVSDGHGGTGYGAFIKSSTFLGEKPFYYGFSSLFGEFTTINELFFETGVLVGYNKKLGKSDLDFDAFMDILITGGRINSSSMTYQSEAPGIHLGLALGFPTSWNIDSALSVSSVIRPYNAQAESWDLSRSYITLGVSLRFKSFAMVESLPWSDSYKDFKSNEEVL